MTTTESTNGDPELVPVQVAVNRVARDIDYVGKATAQQRGRGGGNNAPTYAFRSIEDVWNHLHPILVRHGVVIMPRALDAKFVHHSRTNANGNVSISTSVQQLIAFDVYGPMGDKLEGATFGEGYDVSDKATNKSTSSAAKYFLTTLFSIPTVEMDEPDAVSQPIETGVERPSPENDRHYTRREEMRELIAGLPDDARARVADYLTDNDISLRRACTKPVLDKVDRFIKKLSESTEVDQQAG